MSEEHKCDGAIWIPREGLVVCPNRGKLHEKGAWWCGIHAPSAIARRRAKSEARYQVEENARDKRYAIDDAREAVLKAAREWRASDFSHERHEEVSWAGGRGHTDGERKLAAAVDSLLALESEGA